MEGEPLILARPGVVNQAGNGDSQPSAIFLSHLRQWRAQNLSLVLARATAISALPRALARTALSKLLYHILIVVRCLSAEHENDS